jgi:hypothetical protein
VRPEERGWDFIDMGALESPLPRPPWWIQLWIAGACTAMVAGAVLAVWALVARNWLAAGLLALGTIGAMFVLLAGIVFAGVAQEAERDRLEEES